MSSGTMTMPPLPEPWHQQIGLADWLEIFDEDQMRAYGEACAAAERERCTHSELAEQCAVYARRIMELEKALGECSGALEHAGHPIEWQAKIDAAVAAERERCAKLCEGKGPELILWWGKGQANAACLECAAAIRAQGEML